MLYSFPVADLTFSILIHILLALRIVRAVALFPELKLTAACLFSLLQSFRQSEEPQCTYEIASPAGVRFDHQLSLVDLCDA